MLRTKSGFTYRDLWIPYGLVEGSDYGHPGKHLVFNRKYSALGLDLDRFKGGHWSELPDLYWLTLSWDMIQRETYPGCENRYFKSYPQPHPGLKDQVKAERHRFLSHQPMIDRQIAVCRDWVQQVAQFRLTKNFSDRDSGSYKSLIEHEYGISVNRRFVNDAIVESGTPYFKNEDGSLSCRFAKSVLKNYCGDLLI